MNESNQNPQPENVTPNANQATPQNPPVYQPPVGYGQQPVQYVYYPPQYPHPNAPYYPPQPMYQQPVQPVYQQPVQPVYQQPVQPIYQQPVYPQPIYAPVDPEQLKKKAARKVVRRDSNWVGAAMLFVELFGLIFGLIYGLFNIGSNVYTDGLQYAIYSPFCLGLPFLICCLASKHKLSDVIVFEKHSIPSAIFMIMTGFFFLMVGGIISDLIVYFIPRVGDSYSAIAQSSDPTNIPELLVAVLSSAAIPALVEEFCFRGVALGILRKYGDKFAVIASSLLFALVHSNFYQIPFAFAAGLIFGIMVVKFNSLLPAIILHFLNNALSTIISYVMDSLNIEYSILIDILYYAAFGVIGLLGYLFYRLYTKEKMFIGFESYSGCLTKNAPAGVFFSAPCVIIAIFIYILSSVLVVFAY